MKRNQETSDIIVAKIGSESIDKAESFINDIVYIQNSTRYRVLLVSSWAVEFGRRELGYSKDEVASRAEKDADFKRRLAAYGQASLIESYNKLLKSHGMLAGQILTTHADLEDYDAHFRLARELVNGIWKDGFLPIINENDPLTHKEMDGLKRGADNDANAYMWATKLRADMLAILTTTDGVYKNRDKRDSRIALLPTDVASDEYIERICGNEKSSMGSGGMGSKIRHWRDFVNEGGHRSAHIFDGGASSLINHLEYHEKMQLGAHLKSDEIIGGTVIY